MCPQKTMILCAVAVLFAALPLRADAPSGREQELTRENAELKSQIAALQAEIKALKAKLHAQADLHYGPMLNQPLPNQPLVVPAVPPATSRMPDGTVTREFNGSQVYLIPISGDRNSTPAK